MGAQAAEADDVAQDAFLAAFERIAEFRGEGTFAGWVKRIAARQYLRRLQREKKLSAIAAEEAERRRPTARGGDADHRIDLDEALKVLSAAETALRFHVLRRGPVARRGGGGLEPAAWNGQIPCQTWSGEAQSATGAGRWRRS